MTIVHKPQTKYSNRQAMMSSSSTSSSCIATAADGSIQNICKPTSLPPLPPIIRNDREAYLEQRLGLPPLNNHLLFPEAARGNNDKQEESYKSTTSGTASKNNIEKRKKLPKKWMKNQFGDSASIVVDSQCRLYMAESSIPNSGLGMYSGVDIPASAYVDLNPQIIVPLVDIELHQGRKYDRSLLSNYPWNGHTQVSWNSTDNNMIFSFSLHHVALLTILYSPHYISNDNIL